MTDTSHDRDELITLVDAASARLLATAASLSEGALREPSALPDWTRAHVLVHLARNADGLRNLLLWARTDEPARMYPSRAVRSADIASAPQRSRDVIIADLEAAISRLRIDLQALPIDAWGRQISVTPADVDGEARSASIVPLMRLTEVEIHHIDLAAGYGFGDTPVATAYRLLDFIEERLRALDTGFDVELDGRRWTIKGSASTAASGQPAPAGQLVTGPAGDLLAWLLGRGDGHGCHCDDGRSLPALQSF